MPDLVRCGSQRMQEAQPSHTHTARPGAPKATGHEGMNCGWQLHPSPIAARRCVLFAIVWTRVCHLSCGLQGQGKTWKDSRECRQSIHCGGGERLEAWRRRAENEGREWAGKSTTPPNASVVDGGGSASGITLHSHLISQQFSNSLAINCYNILFQHHLGT